MKANVLRGVGQSLEFTDVEELLPQKGEIVVRLYAASLNRRDLWIRLGKYAGLKFPIILGSDGVGIVSSIGESVHSDWLGKEVIIHPAMNWGPSERFQSRDRFTILGLPHDGTFAEQVKIPVENAFDLPNYLSYQEAAAIPLAGVTAYRALHSRGEIQSGENVLVTGVGGGAASLAVQIAVAAGANVFVTSGTESKIEAAKALGALGGANYRKQGWETALRDQAEGFDLIVDSAGGEGFGKLIDLANPGGRIVLFGATAGPPHEFDSRKVFWKQLSLLGTTMGSPFDFAAMLHAFEEHQIKPLVDRVFPLEEANAALDHMEAGAQTGKIVLNMA